MVMQRFIFFVIFCVSLGIAHAATLDFEDLPAANIADFCGGGGQNVGGFYASQGVANIGTLVFGLNTACGVTGYPANSGDINLFSEADLATITFSSLVSDVSLFYVALDPIVLTAYDSMGNPLAQSAPCINNVGDGCANTDGTTGSNSPIEVSSPNISYVTLGNTGLADEYAFDDLSFTPQEVAAIPEPGTGLLLLFGVVGLSVFNARRRVGRSRMRT